MIIGDMHCDTLDKIADTFKDISYTEYDWSLSKLTNDRYFQVFACYIDKTIHNNAKDRVITLINNFYAQTLKFHDIISVVKNKKLPSSKVMAMLSVEGGDCLEGKIDNLDEFYNLGIRMMTLVWNNKNEIGIPSVIDETSHITEFGAKVVEKMNRLRMCVDVSHLNQAGFWDVAELSKQPLCASHSNSYKICPHHRNLTDEQFLFLKNNGGVVGINVYPPFVNLCEKANIYDLIKHIEHFLSIGGENTIALGCDFDGIDCATIGFEDSSMYESFANELLKLNYSQELVEKIMGKNMIKYIKSVLK